MYPVEKEKQKTIKITLDLEVYEKFIESSKEKGYQRLDNAIIDLIKKDIN